MRTNRKAKCTSNIYNSLLYASVEMSVWGNVEMSVGMGQICLSSRQDIAYNTIRTMNADSGLWYSLVRISCFASSHYLVILWPCCYNSYLLK